MRKFDVIDHCRNLFLVGDITLLIDKHILGRIAINDDEFLDF